MTAQQTLQPTPTQPAPTQPIPTQPSTDQLTLSQWNRLSELLHRLPLFDKPQLNQVILRKSLLSYLVLSPLLLSQSYLAIPFSVNFFSASPYLFPSHTSFKPNLSHSISTQPFLAKFYLACPDLAKSCSTNTYSVSFYSYIFYQPVSTQPISIQVDTTLPALIANSCSTKICSPNPYSTKLFSANPYIAISYLLTSF